MRKLYPETEPYNSFHLQTESEHRVYVEESGNRDGIPVIFFHGGPGSGCNPNHRRYFDPGEYHIIIFDQRGCNRSTPQGEVRNNTTQLLLDDVEQIRKRLGIDQWLLFGGSWGATLALLYARQHPQRVTGMVLRGCFLARQRDLDWFIRDGANRLLPDEWEKLINSIPEQERGDLIRAFHDRVHGPDAEQRLVAARAWSRWATKIVTFNFAQGAESNSSSDGENNNDKLLNEVKIETHFAKNRYFIRDNQILEELSRLPDVPVHIVHGRRDITCLMETSWQLQQGLGNATLEILADAGHLAGEPAMIDALVRATDRMVETFSKQ